MKGMRMMAHPFQVLKSQLLANLSGNGFLVDEEIHRVGGDEGLGHIPDTLVVASLTP